MIKKIVITIIIILILLGVFLMISKAITQYTGYVVSNIENKTKSLLDCITNPNTLNNNINNSKCNNEG